MICDSCKNQEAQYHSIKIINGVKSERHLCGKCQTEASYRASSVKGLSELFSGFTAIGADSIVPKIKKEVKVCASCGTTSKQIISNAVLGCAACYSTFSQILLPMIAKVQNGTHHTGKVPSGSHYSKPSKEVEIERLKQEIAMAAKEERYDDAAALQAKIRAMLHEGGNN